MKRYLSFVRVLADAKARKRGERPTPPYRFEGAENEEEVLAVAETPSSED